MELPDLAPGHSSDYFECSFHEEDLQMPLDDLLCESSPPRISHTHDLHGQTRAHPASRHRRSLAPLFEDRPSKKHSLSPAHAIAMSKKGRKRGSYNCGKCGQPKRGHVCIDTPEKPLHNHWNSFLADQSTPGSPSYSGMLDGPLAYEQLEHYEDELMQEEDAGSLHSTGFAPCTPQGLLNRLKKDAAPLDLPQHSPGHGKSTPSRPSSSPTSSCSSNERYRRALAASGSREASMDADCVSADSYALDASTSREEAMPLACMVQILSRLPPPALVAASNVSRRWRQCAEYVWAAVREAHLSVSMLRAGSEASFQGKPYQDDYIPFFLQNCPNLKQLTLHVSSQINDPLLKCVATSSPQLSSLEVSIKAGGVNNVSGEGLKVLFHQCKLLRSVKLEGCRNIIELDLSSPRLQTFWLTGCDQLKYMLLNCPALSELSLDFLPQGGTGLSSCNIDEKMDHLAALMKNLGNNARGLTKLHVASPWLHDRVVLALLSSGLKSLRMLSLTFGSGITDKSVAAIASCCQNLQLLDLSGSSITDKALELIYRAFSKSLSKLLVALCPKISQVGLQTTISQLPFLQLLDCGRVIVDDCSARKTICEADEEVHDESKLKDQKVASFESLSEKGAFSGLNLQHMRLQKLSLWGCSGLQVLMLDCPELVDLNLTGCSRLKPERLQLLCPSLKDVYVGKCEETLLQVIQSQVEHALFSDDFHVSVSRQADGSKRVQAPHITSKNSRRTPRDVKLGPKPIFQCEGRTKI